MRSIVTGVALVAALVLSPMSACNPFFSYHFGDAELRAAVEGTWRITIPNHAPITITLAQSAQAEHADRGWIHTAAACGTRSLVRTAGACVDATRMALDVAIVDGLPHDTRTGGEVDVLGADFVAADLELQLGHDFDHPLVVEANLSPQGVATARDTGVTLVRIKR